MVSGARGPSVFPQGKDKHHIVVLEAIHVPLPTFDFPHTITLHPRTTPHEVAERVKDASIVIACVCPVLPEHLDQAPALGLLTIMAVGISWVKKDEFAKRNVSVTNSPGANSEAVAEHVLGLYFGVTKRVAQLDAAIKGSTEWRDKGTLTRKWPLDKRERPIPPLGCGMEVLGILGYGNLGKQIEKIARAVGFGEVIISERKSAESVRNGRVAFNEVIKKASTVVVCVPKEEDTVDLISEPELKAMREDAIVINVARGGVVNEAALAKALREGWIAGAAADVLEDEPGGKGTSPLMPGDGEAEVPNLLICKQLCLPHMVRELTQS
jgi:phosphoglycerate dehydrogenase-like enzyme